MHPSLCVRTPNGLTDHTRQANVPHRHETLMLTRHTSQFASLSKPEQRMQQCQASGHPGEPSAQDQPTPSHQQAAATSSPSGGSWFSWQRAKEMQFQLQSMGLAGIVSYGILNTLYYTCTFVFVWLFVLHVPQGMRLLEQGAQLHGMHAIDGRLLMHASNSRLLHSWKGQDPNSPNHFTTLQAHRWRLCDLCVTQRIPQLQIMHRCWAVQAFSRDV